MQIKIDFVSHAKMDCKTLNPGNPARITGQRRHFMAAYS